MENPLNRYKVILCNPEGGINVGSICRAMKNMGLSRLAIVGDTSILDDQWLKNMAVHAMDIFEKAEICTSLHEALADTVLSAGITRRKGNKRKFFSILPEDLAEKSSRSEGTIGLVFGNEQHGLTDKELGECSLSVYIPSSPDFPSLNLSHAVQIICYEIYRHETEKDMKPVYNAINHEKILSLTDVMTQSLKDIGFFKLTDNFNMHQYFRDILSRAQLSIREARQMEKIFRKIQYLKTEKTGSEENDSVR